MPDFAPLPPLPSTPLIVPRAGDMDVVLRRATARRRRDAAVSTLAAVTAVLLAVVLTGEAPDRLHTGPVDQPATPYPTVSSGASSVAGNAAASPGAGHSRIPPAGSSVPSVSPPGSASPTGSPRSARPLGPLPDLKRDVVPLDDLSACPSRDLSASNSLNGWCAMFQPSGTVTRHPGEIATYAAMLCRVPGQGAGVVDFPTSEEVDVVAADSSDHERVFWNWSHGRSFEEMPHELRVEESTCVRWRFVWDTRDNARVVLRPGSYSLQPVLAGQVRRELNTTSSPPMWFVDGATVVVE